MREKHIDPSELTILKSDILFPVFFLSIAFLVFSFSPTAAWAAALPAPTNLTATAASSRQINLSWKDNATTETNYYVERSPNGSSSWTVIATLGANVTSYQNTGLTQNTTYYYRVRCKAGSTYSSYSNTANTKTATLAAPTALSATVASASQINLSWTDNTAYETNYSVERSPNGSSTWTVIATLGVNVTTYTNTGLTVGTAYYYRVRAYDGTNYSAYSSVVNQTIRTIAASAGSNGAISPSGTVAVANGTSNAFTMTPNTGYKIASVKIDGSAVATNSTYTFSNITANHTIAATFSANTFTITASTGANGTISPIGAVAVNGGASQTFTLTSNTGYHVSSFLVDGASVGAVSTYTFTNVTSNHTIAASFAINTYTITAAAGANGTISPSGTVSVNSGATTTFTVTPNTGYHVSSVLVDNASVGTVSTYVFTNVTANHTITASFAINTYTITASAGANGTILPSGIVSVNSGATTTFTITPTTGYHVADVVMDGASVGAVSTYTFTKVTASHTITASFAVSDTIPPTGSIVINNGSSITNTATVNLTLSATDSGSGVAQMQFSNDGTTWSTPEAYATSKSWTLNTGDGTKTVSAKFKDNAGNWMRLPCSSSISLDATPPTVTITSPAAGNTNNSTPTLTYTVSDGIVAVKVDGSVVNKVLGNTLDALADGTHTVRVEATDSATNTGFAEVVILVSSNPGIPSISITSPNSGATNGRTPLLSYTVSSGVVVIKVDGIIVNKTSGSALDALADGTHTVRVEAVNALGNAYFAEIAFTVDTEPPISAKTLKQIAAGTIHSAAIVADGSLFIWGDNWAGQLGNGTTTSRSLPGSMGTDRSWAIIAAGYSYNLALKSDGTLWAWGYNDNGQLGDGTTVRKYVPIQIGTDNDWKTVATSGSHSLALKKDGTLWAWGANWSGQVGDGSTTDKYAPVRIGTDSDWAVISANGHSMALKQNGTLWVWGSNWAGQLGDGSTDDKYVPNRIGTASNWTAISAGAMHSVALKSDGSLWTWGYNENGELGDGTAVEKHVPTRIGAGTNWSRISSGDTHVIALKSDSTLWAWGYNYDGELGDGTKVDKHAPIRIGTGNTWVSIKAGSYYSFALITDGTLWAWGDNASGELGDGTTQNRKSPANITTFGNMLVINNGDASTNDTLVTLTLNAWDATSGVAFMRFSNDGTTWSASEPYAATKSWMLGSRNGTKTVSAMFQDAAGNWSSVYNSSILLSVGPTIVSIISPTAGFTQSNTPVLSFTINKGDTVNTVKVDNVVVNKVSGNVLAALADGLHTVRVEAVDANGILGFAEVSFTVDSVPPSATITSPIGLTNNNRPTLNYTVNKVNTTSIVKVDNMTVNTVSGAALDVLPDGSHRLRVETTDTYGYKTSAEATFTVDTEPPAGAIAVRFKNMDAGGYHSAAIARDGTLWAWGSGLLGDGTSVSKILPTLIGTDTDWAAVSVGTQHTGAIKSDGSLWTWGSRYNGRLGIGPTMDIYVPTRVGTDTDWTVISAGGDHTAAIKSDRTLWTWGSNSAGQLGNHDYTWNDQWVPVQVGYSGNIAVSAGDAHTVALDANGTIWVTGSGLDGQLGREADPPYYYQKYFSAMVPYTDWAAVSAGEIHTAAIKTDGTLWAWGNGVYTPTQIGTDNTWTAVSAGWGHTLALKSDGTLWAWGSNPYGQLGDGTTVDKSAPVRVGNDTDWIAVSAGGYDALVNNNYFNDGGYSLALKSNGTLWAWGINSSGQLGDGTTQNHLTPQQVNANLGSGNPILINNGAAAANSAFVSLTLSAWDVGSGTEFMKFSNDGTTWIAPETYATIKAWTLSPGDGSKTVSVKFQDKAGNWSPAYSASIVLDTVTPTVTITSPTAGTTNHRNPILIYMASQGTVVVKVDGSKVYKVSGDALDALNDGSHTVRVEATNAVGTDFAEVIFTVDTIAPTVTITSSSVGPTNNRTPMLTYTVSDGTVVVKVDGNEVNKVSGNMLDALSDGSHSVRVEATDAVNNTGFATVTFTVDTVAPTVTITSPSGYTNSKTLLLIYTVSDGAVVVKVDGYSVNKVSGDTLDTMTNGDHTVRIEARDAANNLGSAEVTFTVDTSSAGNDDTNIYCMGTGTYRVGYSNFIGNISVPMTNNEVRIASPLNYSTIYGPRTIIKGAMDTTIPVNTVSVLVTNSTGSTSYLAQVNGKYFAAQVSLSAGDNAITVTATDQNSAKHQASVIVNNVIQSENVELQAAPNVGIPTLKQSNRTTLDVFLASTASIQYPGANYAWDFNGTGANSLTCYSHSNVTASYEQIGLYLTTVTVTDAAGNTFADTVIVNVLEASEMTSAFKTIWGRMKAALLGGDIATALVDYSENTKSRFQQIFAQLISANTVSAIYSNMTDIVISSMDDQIAECWALRQESDGTHAYPVTFVKGENGIWKIMGY